MPSSQYDQLEELAQKDECSKNYFIRKALDNYLEDIYFARKAEGVLDKGITTTYSLDEIRKKHDL